MIHGKNLRKEGCMNNAKIVLLLGRQLANQWQCKSKLAFGWATRNFRSVVHVPRF